MSRGYLVYIYIYILYWDTCLGGNCLGEGGVICLGVIFRVPGGELSRSMSKKHPARW